MLLRPYERYDPLLGDQDDVQNILAQDILTCACSTRPQLYTSLTLIFEVGTNVSAMLFRSPGSSLRQCREDVLMAMSHSSRASSEYSKGSAPEIWKSACVQAGVREMRLTT